MTAAGLAERLVDPAFAAGWRLVRMLPSGVATAVFEQAGELAARRAGTGVQTLRANLSRVVPDAGPAELDVLVRAGMRSYARYWCEAFRLPAISPGHIVEATVQTGIDPALAALAEGRGVVFALPHSGNWDAAGVWIVETMRRHGLRAGFSTVVERLRPEPLYRRFVAYRESLGFEVFSADDGAAVYRGLVSRLRAGGLVCLVADRDLGASGVDVTLFGQPARMPPGPARLAAMTGALLMPVHSGFEGAGWRLTIGAPIPVPGKAAVAAATQALADVFTETIRRAPQDWHMLQPYFTADLRTTAAAA